MEHTECVLLELIARDGHWRACPENCNKCQYLKKIPDNKLEDRINKSLFLDYMKENKSTW